MFDELRNRLREIYWASRSASTLDRHFDDERLNVFSSKDFPTRISALMTRAANDENSLLHGAFVFADAQLASLWVMGNQKFCGPARDESPSWLCRSIPGSRAAFNKLLSEESYSELSPGDKAVLKKLKRFMADSFEKLSRTYDGRSGDTSILPIYATFCKAIESREDDFQKKLNRKLKSISEETKLNNVEEAAQQIVQSIKDDFVSMMTQRLHLSMLHQSAARVVLLSIFRFHGIEPDSWALGASMKRINDISGVEKVVPFIMSEETFLIYALCGELDSRGVSTDNMTHIMNRFATTPSRSSYDRVLFDLDSPKIDKTGRGASLQTSETENDRDCLTSYATSNSGSSTVVQSVVHQVSTAIDTFHKRSNSSRLARLLVYAAGKSGTPIGDILNNLESKEPEEILDELRSATPKQERNYARNHAVQEAKIRLKESVDILGESLVTIRIAEPLLPNGQKDSPWSVMAPEDMKQLISRIRRMQYGSFGDTRAILLNFKATGVYELRFRSGMRALYAQTGENEFTILGIMTRKSGSALRGDQAQTVDKSLSMLQKLRDGGCAAIDFNEFEL